MPTDPERDLVRIGRVGRPHGVDGAFVVEAASQDPTRFEVGAEILVDGAPARVVLVRHVGGRRIAVKLDRAVSRGAELAVPRDLLPELPADSYYVVELVGLEVVDDSDEPLGRVVEVHPGVANDNLELDDGVLVPLVEDAIRTIDVDARRIVVRRGFLS